MCVALRGLILAFYPFLLFSEARQSVAKKSGEMLMDLTLRHQNL